MNDFNEYASKQQNSTSDNGNLFDLINSIAKKYDGKSQNELLMAIYKEATKRKRAGTLSNQELEGFKNVLSPLLDDKKRAILNKIVEELKKI